MPQYSQWCLLEILAFSHNNFLRFYYFVILAIEVHVSEFTIWLESKLERSCSLRHPSSPTPEVPLIA